jgi:hypothetical protein
MDPGWIATVIVVVINIFGWGATWGKLNGRIKNLETTTDRHEKVLNDGLVDKLSELASRCASLEGTVQTYIGLHQLGKER